MSNPNGEAPPRNFIRDVIDADLESGKHTTVVTRFPPEPNGYMHIGHAKSVVINFGLARDYGGRCHLRFDDTNPTKEDIEYVEAMQRDIRWLGFDWGEHLYFASDYYQRLYDLAEGLIRDGKAYVCSLPEEQLRQYRGTITEVGRPSPYRDRSVQENLDLFRRMRDNAFDEGAHVLRAKIDMASPNMKMRDPPIYRILKAHHFRQGDTWCIYPLYDFTHGLSDSFEGVTHSLCTLEFENNRELYNWFVTQCDVPCEPRQYEFARLGLNYTIMSKRWLLRLVQEGHVTGWDDPRMPTIAGLRRRGVFADAILNFCDRIGVAKANSVVDMSLLDWAIRDDLNMRSPRVLAVADPLPVTLTNWPEGTVDTLVSPSFPTDVGKPGSREVPFSGTLFIDRADFMETPAKGFKRLAPGREVRLRHGYYITCNEVLKDTAGDVVELRCSVDLETRGGKSADGRKVSGTIQWVSAAHAVPCQLRLYDRLFTVEKPGADVDDFMDHINPASLVVKRGYVEHSVGLASVGDSFQFERMGYFAVDPDSKDGGLIFNLTVALRDSWSPTKEASQPKKQKAPKTKQVVTAADKAAADNRKMLTEPGPLKDFFNAALAEHDNEGAVGNWVLNDVQRVMKEQDELKFGGAEIGQLVALLDAGKITSQSARQVFQELADNGGSPAAIVDRLGLQALSDPGALAAVIDALVTDNPDEAGRYRGGEQRLIGFFIGKALKATQGKADAKAVRAALLEKLG